MESFTSIFHRHFPVPGWPIRTLENISLEVGTCHVTGTVTVVLNPGYGSTRDSDDAGPVGPGSDRAGPDSESRQSDCRLHWPHWHRDSGRPGSESDSD